MSTTNNQNQGDTTEKIAQLLRRGVRPRIKTEVDRDHAAGKFGWTWAEFEPLQLAAQKIVRAEQVRAKLAAGRRKLVENDTSDPAPAPVVDRLEAAVRELLPEDELEAFNSELRKKSGSLTYRDVAFVGVVHRDSVTRNGQAEERFRNTSPFSRIQKTSASNRDVPLDNRQVRYALSLLEALGFTTEESPAVRSANKSVSRAAVWSLSTDPFWTGIFAGF